MFFLLYFLFHTHVDFLPVFGLFFCLAVLVRKQQRRILIKGKRKNRRSAVMVRKTRTTRKTTSRRNGLIAYLVVLPIVAVAKLQRYGEIDAILSAKREKRATSSHFYYYFFLQDCIVYFLSAVHTSLLMSAYCTESIITTVKRLLAMRRSEGWAGHRSRFNRLLKWMRECLVYTISKEKESEK